MLARMRLDQEGFKAFYLTGTLWPKHSINQHGKEGSKEGRSRSPSPQGDESDEGQEGQLEYHQKAYYVASSPVFSMAKKGAKKAVAEAPAPRAMKAMKAKKA